MGDGRDEGFDVVFAVAQVLAGGGDDIGSDNGSCFVQLVLVPEDAAGYFDGAYADARAWLCFNKWFFFWGERFAKFCCFFYVVNEFYCLGEVVEEGAVEGKGDAVSCHDALRGRAEPLVVVVEAGECADEVALAFFDDEVGGGVAFVVFVEEFVVALLGEARTLRGEVSS